TDGTKGADGIPDVLTANGQNGTLSIIPGLANGKLRPTGFFNDQPGIRQIQPLAGQANVFQPPFVNPNLGFALTDRGDLLRFDPLTGATATITAGQPINAFSVVAHGSSVQVFTANADGTLSELKNADTATTLKALKLDSGL